VINAIIFDCFGVLTTEAFIAFRDKYMADSEDKKLKANQFMDDLNTATISYDEFSQGLSDLSGIAQEKVEEYLSEGQPNQPLFDLIRGNLKPKYKIGMLSNAGDDWLDDLFNPEDIALFDDKILSFEHGMIKPDPRIYLLAAKRLGVKPDECVFIDDAQRHCEGAKAVGMQAILYKDFAQMKTELEHLLNQSA
jgi:epoxide hydrolase-like predicted phosphatase